MISVNSITSKPLAPHPPFRNDLVCSDCCSNSIRVIKTVKQTSTVPITYTAAAKQVIDKDGVMGLLGRGLKTRIMANGMQGIMFKVLWKLFEDKLNAK
mmetsp:Transcript_29005/g.46575  ORF Transcript_29005/g.46575 Transcript_29005/m.46575 type:complete len:98 (+) Transcript_29005:819-1112(+)